MDKWVAFLDALVGFLQHNTAGLAVALLVLSFFLILTLLTIPIVSNAARRPLYILIGAFMTLSAVFLIVAVLYPGGRMDRPKLESYLRDIESLSSKIVTEAEENVRLINAQHIDRHNINNGASNNRKYGEEIKSLARLALENLANAE